MGLVPRRISIRLRDDELVTDHAEDALSEVHQFTSLLRAKLTAVLDGANDADELMAHDAVRLWDAAYGCIRFTVDNVDEAGAKMSEILGTKMSVATLIACTLAAQLAAERGCSPIEVIDQIERDLIEEHGGD